MGGADAGGDEGDYGRDDGGTDNDSVHCEQSSWGFACVLRWSAHRPCHQGWLRLAGPSPVVNRGAKHPIACWLENAHVLSCVGGWQSR